MRSFTSKYISIFLLSFILFEPNVSAQKKKNKKTSNKRVATRMLNRSPVTKTTAATQTETTAFETITQEESQPAVDPQILSSKTTEIENLKSQNQLLKDKIAEKQQKYNSMNSDSDDIIEKYQNLELKYNKSKNVCTSINTKQMSDIQGWLIATVAASGVGTVANTTATVTSFMQKDQTQIDKQNEKNIQKLENKKKELDNKLNKLSNEYSTNDNLSIEERLKAQDKFNKLENERNELDNTQAKQTSIEQQAKKNKTLKNVSAISNIVGTVASGASTITSTVAISLVSSITKQVKKCKESF